MEKFWKNSWVKGSRKVILIVSDMITKLYIIVNISNVEIHSAVSVAG